MSQLLRIEGLCVEGRPPGGDYSPIVKDINITVNAGEVIALIGESGSGKSTISLAALAYARPGCRISGGRVMLNGEDILKLSSEGKRRLRGSRVSYVAQSAAAAFNPSMRIDRQITEISRVHGTQDNSTAIARARDLYRKLDLPEPDSIGMRYPHQVSGGQLQRLMAAMALSSDPELVIFDEPTTALDVTTQIEVLKSFKEIIKTRKTAAIYVSHDLAVVTQMADRIVVLLNGRIVEQGPTEQIISNPEHEYTRTLMAAVRKTPIDEIDARAANEISSDDKVLSIRGLNAAYISDQRILSDVNIDVNRVETIGVIGESGCGKSTLARVIAGLLPPTDGQIWLNGKIISGELKNRSKDELKRCQIVFQMADVALNPRQTIDEILGRPLTFYTNIKGEDRRKRVEELLELVELPASFSTRFPGELSGGQKQRVNLARALAAEPDVILCDEVTSALDTVVAASIIDLLKSLQERLGLSYVFISHDLSTVAAFADRVAVIYSGHIVEIGSTREVLSPPFHPYTKLLLSSVPEIRQDWLEEIMHSAETLKGIGQGVIISNTGCPFVSRCPLAIEQTCNGQNPPRRQLNDGHEILCHHEIEKLLEFGGEVKPRCKTPDFCQPNQKTKQPGVS